MSHYAKMSAQNSSLQPGETNSLISPRTTQSCSWLGWIPESSDGMPLACQSWRTGEQAQAQVPSPLVGGAQGMEWEAYTQQYVSVIITPDEDAKHRQMESNVHISANYNAKDKLHHVLLPDHCWT